MALPEQPMTEVVAADFCANYVELFKLAEQEEVSLRGGDVALIYDEIGDEGLAGILHEQAMLELVDERLGVASTNGNGGVSVVELVATNGNGHRGRSVELRSLKPGAMGRALKRCGLVPVTGDPNHALFQNPDTGAITGYAKCDRKELGPGVIGSMLKQAGISRDQFRAAL